MCGRYALALVSHSRDVQCPDGEAERQEANQCFEAAIARAPPDARISHALPRGSGRRGHKANVQFRAWILRSRLSLLIACCHVRKSDEKPPGIAQMCRTMALEARRNDLVNRMVITRRKAMLPHCLLILRSKPRSREPRGRNRCTSYKR